MPPAELFDSQFELIAFYTGVFGCVLPWLLAYFLIIKLSFKEKTFGMPIVALCLNITWEFLFGFVVTSDYLLIWIGNMVWCVVDLIIFVAIWKYAKDDFEDPVIKKLIHPGMIVGVIAAFTLFYPFTFNFGDTKGYCLGWIAAAIMCVLFIAMLIRRKSSKGQSIWIATSMLVGNFFAWVWVNFDPELGNQGMDRAMNSAFMIVVGFFNVVYIVMLYRQGKSEGINPWSRV